MPYATNPVDGAPIWYEQMGAGPAVLMYHGFSRSMLEWLPYTAALAEHFSLVLMDARGHGRSAKTTDPDAYAMTNRVADVCAVLDAAEVPAVHYVGYSMGGQVGFGMARYARERLMSLTVGGMHPYPPDADAAAQRGGFAESLASGLPGHVERMEARLGGPLPEPYRAELLANDGAALAAVSGATRDGILHEGLSDLNLPALLYCGSNDGFYAGAERAAGEIPGHSSSR